jgi:hypothetical protein
VTPAEAVFTYTREAGDARYVLVVNDHRQSGPQYEKWKVTLNAIGRKPHEPLRDQGLAQDVQVTVPAGLALYDVLKHRRLDATPIGVRQRASLTLEPGGAAVIAAFPRPLKQLVVTAPSRLTRGNEATVALQVLDESGRAAPGRQMAEVRVLRPDGQAWSGQQRYRRIVDGRLSMPLRLPRSAQPGEWRIEVLEWTSGLRATATVNVE